MTKDPNYSKLLDAPLAVNSGGGGVGGDVWPSMLSSPLTVSEFAKKGHRFRVKGGAIVVTRG